MFPIFATNHVELKDTSQQHLANASAKQAPAEFLESEAHDLCATTHKYNGIVGCTGVLLDGGVIYRYTDIHLHTHQVLLSYQNSSQGTIWTSLASWN